MTKLILNLHVIAGTIALCAGIVALSSRKGGRTHRVSGTVFFASMLIMAIFADYLAIAIPEQIPNLFIGTFTIYLVVTAWLSVRRKEQSVGVPEKVALVVVLCLCLPFAVLSFQLATGSQPSFKSATPFEGPVRIAIYSFTFIVAMAGRQVSLDRRRNGRTADWAASLAYVSRVHFGGRLSVHDRIATATPENRGRSHNPLVYPSIVLTGVDDPLDDPCAVHELVQRISAELNQRRAMLE